jgi:hypothetical protein
MILTFAKTEAEFLAGIKTVTRRFYKSTQTARWQAQWDKGNHIHKAYDKSPRQGGKQIGWLKLTERPYVERLSDMPESELEAEGGMVDSLEAFQALVGKGPDDEATVIRFEKADP